MVGERFFGFAGCRQQAALGAGWQCRQSTHAVLRAEPLGNYVVKIVTPQSRVAAGGQHLEHPFGQAQDGNVEGTATEVINGKSAFRRLVQPVGNCGSGGFVEQAQHAQPGQTGSIFGGLALGIVKIGGHGDDHTCQWTAQGHFSAFAQGGQNLSRYLNRGAFTGDGADAHHAGRIHKAVGQTGSFFHVRQAAPHETFDRHNRVLRVFNLAVLRLAPHHNAVAWQIAHHRGQQQGTVFVGQRPCHRTLHRGNQRVGSAQVNARRQPVLVWCSALAGLDDLE